MNPSKIEHAVERLERNLPIRPNQTQLPVPLRQLHQRILRFYLENNVAPRASDLADVADWQAAIDQLAAAQIIVLDNSGSITGAYPFVNEVRDSRVTTNYGTVNAMCAFDALAVSSMFALPTQIESSCPLSTQAILIEQHGADIQVRAPAEPVFAAIDWNAAIGASSCADSLCTEMIFIAGEDRSVNWHNEDCVNRELFGLAEAHALITKVFLPLMET